MTVRVILPNTGSVRTHVSQRFARFPALPAKTMATVTARSILDATLDGIIIFTFTA